MSRHRVLNSALQFVLSVIHESLPPVAAGACDASDAPIELPVRSKRTRRLALALITLVVLTGAFLLVLAYPNSSAQDASDQWVAATMLTPRNSHTMTELLDGRLLAAGGWDGTAPLDSAELFDPAQRAWTPTGALRETRAYHSAARLPDGRVLVAGGWDLLGRPLTSTESYDPAAGGWRPEVPLRQARAGHVAVSLADGRILVAAGCGPNVEALATAEVYDAKAAAWQAAGTLAEGRCWPTATVLTDGRVLLVGGRGRDGQAVGSAELYDPLKDAWTPAGQLLTPRLEHTATLLPDGRVLVAGGYDGSAYLASAEVYDPATNAWTATGSLNVAQANHAALLLRNGQVVVAGGVTNGRPSQQTEAYHPQTGKWTPSGSLPAAYESFLATLLADDHVLVSGRPDSGDPTGNDGYPTPTPVSRTPRPPRTPGPPWLLTPPPAPPQGAAKSVGEAPGVNRDQGSLAEAQSAANLSRSNFTTGIDTARLFGTHEISFTLSSVANPYAITVTVAFTSPQGAVEVVRAFYDGQRNARDVWGARVYVDQVGTWGWAPPAGAQHPVTGQAFTTTQTFPAEAALDSKLRGMLRVAALATPSATTPGSPKRWYTDDGRTFLPMADTAYLLFFDRPITNTVHPGPTICPRARPADYVQQYAGKVTERGINVLRAYALGAIAFDGQNVACETDLSLWWSSKYKTVEEIEAEQENFFDASPTLLELGAPTKTYYPNLRTFKAIDEKLKALLNQYPGLYIQMILVGDAYIYDVSYMDVKAELRQQIWQTMAARWAAFPNVFWTVTNDTWDDEIQRPKHYQIANEIGCYLADNRLSLLGCGTADYNPWRQNRPMSLGHLRDDIDSASAKPWHSYITAYTWADLSAQQMDGSMDLPGVTKHGYATAMPKPVYNVEDLYEREVNSGTGVEMSERKIDHPDYFFRRLFWSYLLSGSGATYGSGPTRLGSEYYPTARATPLVGLNQIQVIPTVLADAHLDLSLFRPQDAIIRSSITPTPTTAWDEYNRAQVAYRDDKEIIAYIPNTDPLSPLIPSSNNRQKAAAASNHASFGVAMLDKGFTDSNYAVTWYDPTGANPPSAPTVVPGGNEAHYQSLTAPFPGDAIVHLSSRCTGANRCLWMDERPFDFVTQTQTLVGDFWVAGSLQQEQNLHVIGNSWRCAAPAGCLMTYNFGNGSAATADVYFRRSTHHENVELEFHGGISKDNWPAPPECPWAGGASVHVVIGVNDIDAAYTMADGTVYAPDADTVFAKVCVEYYADCSDPYPVHDCSSNLVPGAVKAADLDRWYRLGGGIQRDSSNQYRLKISLDGAELPVANAWWNQSFPWGDVVFFDGSLFAWSLPGGSSVWLDELAIDPVLATSSAGLFRMFFQQGLGGYAGTAATYFDGAAGYNNANVLRVGANNYDKALLRFDVTAIPANAVIDEATLALYYTGRSNANALTLGAHGVLAAWDANAANRTQRQTGVNWAAPGLAAGSDYTAAPVTTLAVTGGGGAWVDLDVTALAQTWVTDASQNHGLLLQQTAASGFVVYSFCSELGWSPCTPAQAPKLTLRYHLAEPPPVKATVQQGANGYTGTQATYFDASGSGYNASPYLRVDATGAQKGLLRFALPALPVTATVDEATLRLYLVSRSNANGLTLAARQVLADWSDSQANRTQRQNGVNWQSVGLGAGSDYALPAQAAASTVELASAGGVWVEVDVKEMAQAWVAEPATNCGLALLAQAASGFVTYSFCSELGWSPCTPAQAPQLVIWYH